VINKKKRRATRTRLKREEKGAKYERAAIGRGDGFCG